MFSKHARGYTAEDVPGAKRLRSNLSDLFLSNEISAARAHSLFVDAVASGTKHVGDLAAIGSRSKPEVAPKNMCRNMIRKLLKGNRYPKPYIWKGPVHNKKTDCTELASLAIWLPHELVAAFAEHCPEGLMSQAGFDVDAAVRHDQNAATLGIHPDRLLSLGLWLDGCPCNWDRTQSLETIAMSFPGLVGKGKHVRIPLFGLEKHFVVKGETFNSIMEVVKWSLTMLAAGQRPTCRHDNGEWRPSDKCRAKLSGNLQHAALLEVRGDWMMYRDVFRFPAHNENAGCCWKCRATPTDIRSTSSDASWREPQNRLTIWTLTERMIQRGIQPSPLLSAPCVGVETFLVDWLHAVDLGVLCDFLGNLFNYIVESRKVPGGNRKNRVAALFQLIQDYYRRHPEVESKFSNLTPTMIRTKRKQTA